MKINWKKKNEMCVISLLNSLKLFTHSLFVLCFPVKLYLATSYVNKNKKHIKKHREKRRKRKNDGFSSVSMLIIH